ncbi:hypothetical protein ACP2W0_19290 [Pseudobacillus badius]|uniref:hypothetical protein n=1 Tax=Bacillus badius TaxID=1455 RepID=UPI003CFB912A
MDAHKEEWYQAEIDRLKEIIGSWRRKAQGKGTRRECVREGYSSYYGSHYKVYLVKDIPIDLPMKEVLQELKRSFLPSVIPYQFERIDYSRKNQGWLVQVVDYLPMDMKVRADEKI